MTPFTFEIIDGRIPVITIDGHPFSLVNCVYFWSTATETTVGIQTAIVSGYLVDEFTQKNFRLIFSTGEAIEFL
jgi:cell shape-determining protein MreD